MKQHISVDDIRELTQSQRDHLSSFWIPKKYDRAVAVLCKNAATEEMDYIEFVVGNVHADTDNRGNCSIMLEDLSKSAVIQSQDGSAEALEGSYEQAENDENSANEDPYAEETDPDEEYDSQLYDDMEFEEEDISERDPDYYENNYFVPDIFVSSECLPLFSVGQMIELLREKGFGRDGIFISVFEDESYVDRDGGGDGEFAGAELCDTLWEAVKRLF